MKSSTLIPLVLIVSLSTLASCTRPNEMPSISGEKNLPTPLTEMSSGAESSASNNAITTTRVVQYQSPAGTDDVEFSVTVENGIITAVSSRTLATNDGSKYNQDKFASEVAGKVVGKSVKDFDIDVIG